MKLITTLPIYIVYYVDNNQVYIKGAHWNERNALIHKADFIDRFFYCFEQYTFAEPIEGHSNLIEISRAFRDGQVSLEVWLNAIEQFEPLIVKIQKSWIEP